MNPEETPNNSTNLVKSTISDIINNVDGIPLPPTVKKSLWKAIGSLITGLFDVPVAHLEAKSQQIREEANALSLITKKASEAAAVEFYQDKFLVERTVNHFGSKLLRQQINREETVKKAIEELKDVPIEDSKEEIDPDWLETFSRIAESKSNEDVQLFLSKILAGEIKSPGTFSQRTIQTLSLLDQNTAQLFQSFCNISFGFFIADHLTCVVHAPFEGPGSNGLSPFGLSYTNLAKLQDAGLIQSEFSAYKESPVHILESFQMVLGNTVYNFRSTEETPEKIRFDCINFTQVGLELRKVIHVTGDPAYNKSFFEWLENTYKIKASIAA